MELNSCFPCCSTELCSHGSIFFVCLGQYSTIMVTISLCCNLKLDMTMPPAVFFLLRISLVVLGVLCFHMSFKIFPIL